MNIALFASAFYPHLGGVEEHVRQLARVLRERGIGVIVVTNRWPPTLPAQEEVEGIVVYRLPMRLSEGSLRERVKYTLTQPWTTREMLTILRRHAIDLIHVHCVSVNGYYALLAQQALGLPLVVTAHGERTMDAARIYERSPFINQVLRDLLAQAGAITACSRHTLDDIETFYGQPFGARARVVYNGIRPQDFADVCPYTHSRPYVLGLGRLVPQKGFDVLIDAFAQSGLDTHDLLIAGEGPEHDALKSQIANRRLQSRVCLLGRADRSMAVSLFAGCDCFVLPSRQEPQGIVLLEAMACGKAVIASCVGGVPEVVADGKTGLLVPPDDAPALAHSLLRLNADSALHRRLETNGRELSRQFAWPIIAADYLNIYNALL